MRGGPGRTPGPEELPALRSVGRKSDDELIDKPPAGFLDPGAPRLAQARAAEPAPGREPDIDPRGTGNAGS